MLKIPTITSPNWASPLNSRLRSNFLLALLHFMSTLHFKLQMSKTERLIFLIKCVPSIALPIALNSNSIILVAEAKILTILLHPSLPHNSQSVYQEILWALPSKHILNPCTSYHSYLDYPAPAILIISLTFDS